MPEEINMTPDARLEQLRNALINARANIFMYTEQAKTLENQILAYNTAINDIKRVNSISDKNSTSGDS